MNIFDISLYSQLLTALLGCIFLFKKRSFFVKLLTLLLVVTFLVELASAYLGAIGKSNFNIYYYYILFQCFAIFFLYEKLIKDKKYLIVSYVLLVVFIVLWGVAFFKKEYFFNAMIIEAFNIGVLIFLYLRELLLSDEIINYKRLLPFWVSVGFMVFYLPVIPFFSFLSYMKNRDLRPILISLTVLMNLIISFGLLWSNRKGKY